MEAKSFDLYKLSKFIILKICEISIICEIFLMIFFPDFVNKISPRWLAEVSHLFFRNFFSA